METVTLSSKGQIVIPKELRELHNLNAGTEFIVSFSGDEIRLLPVPVFPPTRVEAGMGALAKAGRQRLGDAETEQAIKEMLLHDDAASKS